MENGTCSFVVPSPKYKRRKVFAVRNFPLGCGRNNQCLKMRPAQEMEIPVTANALENLDFVEGSIDGSENGASGLFEDLHEVVAATLNDKIIPILLDGNFLSPSNMLVAVSNGTGFKKNMTRKFPPRRKVSGIRNFPPNCGRKSSHPNKEESTEERASSENKRLSPEKSEAGENGKTPRETPRETVKVDVQKTVEDAQGGDLRNRSEAAALPIESESEIYGQTRTATVKIDEVQDGDLLYKGKVEKSVSKENRDTVAMGSKTLGQETSISRVDEELSKGKVMTDRRQSKGDAQPMESQQMFLSSKNKSFSQGQSRQVMDAETATEAENADLNSKQLVDLSLVGDSHRSTSQGHVSEVDKTEVHYKRENIRGDEYDVKVEHKEGEKGKGPFVDELVWWDHEIETVAVKGEDDVEGSEEHIDEEVDADPEEKAGNEKQSDTSSRDNQLQAVDLESLGPLSDRVVVQGLMAASFCPRKQGNDAVNSKAAAVTSRSKGKKREKVSHVEGKTKMTARKKIDVNDSNLKKFYEKADSQGTGQLVIRDKDKSLERNEREDRQLALVSSSADVCVPPLNPSISNQKHEDNDAVGMRRKVRESLRLYQVVCRKLLQEEETKLKEGKQGRRRIDLAAANILKVKGRFVNQEKIFGPVPGVEVGDEFQYRIELNVIGLHRQIQGGIDYAKRDGKILATSIVASGGYADDLDNSDVLVYTGQGGNVMNAGKEPEDQKLERGNLALKNSLDYKNPVRVIRGCELSEGRSEGKAKTYVYDGLYTVEKFWQDVGPHGKLVFQFQLERIPGQPELAWKEVKKSKKCKLREGLCVDDISQGKEVIPICAVNTIDDEKPPLFTYITRMIYPDWYQPTPPTGCSCGTRCSDSAKCSCAVRNGGEIPYNHNGAIVEVKPLVFECGPSCKCSSSCHNRVTQRGVKFQLEIFKTQKRGWGVRSLNFIPSGSFICEYLGELLKEKEAEERAGNDEYLFDIGNNYNDNTLWDGLETLIPDLQHVSSEVVEDGCFTIDAAQFGNVGRFFNHSCTPNMYAQNVLYDYDDKRIPRIMFFAAENIPALQELTYHYNYTIDQVWDSNGEIKKKSCFCGSLECTGRLY